MGHAKADRLLIRPTHGDRAGAGSEGGQSPIEGTQSWAVQYSGHAFATATSLRSPRQEPVDATLTVSIQPFDNRRRSSRWQLAQANRSTSFAVAFQLAGKWVLAPAGQIDNDVDPRRRRAGAPVAGEHGLWNCYVGG